MKKKNPLSGKSEAQAAQDLFALDVCTRKSYIEIGGNHPRRINNTFNLDYNHKWKGFSVELIEKWSGAWSKSSRNNICYFKDAITFDYIAALKEQGMEIIPNPDIAAFRAAMGPAYKRITEYAGEENVKRFLEIVETARR